MSEREGAYHVSVGWNRCEVLEARAVCLKKMIDEYPEEWQLVNIGEVTDDYVHLLFKSREQGN